MNNKNIFKNDYKPPFDWYWIFARTSSSRLKPTSAAPCHIDATTSKRTAPKEYSRRRWESKIRAARIAAVHNWDAVWVYKCSLALCTARAANEIWSPSIERLSWKKQSSRCCAKLWDPEPLWLDSSYLRRAGTNSVQWVFDRRRLHAGLNSQLHSRLDTALRAMLDWLTHYVAYCKFVSHLLRFYRNSC